MSRSPCNAQATESRASPVSPAKVFVDATPVQTEAEPEQQLLQRQAKGAPREQLREVPYGSMNALDQSSQTYLNSIGIMRRYPANAQGNAGQIGSAQR